jgi:hypothetical protein
MDVVRITSAGLLRFPAAGCLGRFLVTAENVIIREKRLSIKSAKQALEKTNSARESLQ